MHAGLASLVEREGARLEGRRILLYSYGSGLAASLWSVIARRVDGAFSLASMAAKVQRARGPQPPTRRRPQPHHASDLTAWPVHAQLVCPSHRTFCRCG